MFNRFFTVLLISPDNRLGVNKYKVRWFWLVLLIALVAGCGYLLSYMSYEVFLVRRNFASLEAMNQEHLRRELILQHSFETQLHDFINLDRLKVMHEDIMGYIDLPQDDLAHNLDEPKLANQATDQGILSVIAEAAIIEDQTQAAYEKFYDYLNSNQLPTMVYPDIWPVEGFVFDEFGTISSDLLNIDEPLRGLLIGTKRFEPVKVTATGVVVEVGVSAVFGKFIEVFHGLGFITRYHNVKDPVVEIGSFVQKGDLIATVDINQGLGISYLYYQIIAYGVPQNPISYIL